MANTLVFTLVGKDKLGPVFDSAGRKADGFGGKLAAAGKVAAVGLKALAAGGAVAAAGLGVAIKQAIPFDKTMRQVGAIAGISGKELKTLSDLAIQMGEDTVFGAGDAAQAMLELAKGGITPAQIQAGVLAGTLTLATAGELEMGSAATYLANTLNTFGLQAKDSNRVVAALAGGANASSASVESLGMALSQVGPGAKLAGMSLEQTVAVLAAFDNAGVKGSDAGTSLKTMLQRLVPVTNTAKNAMKDLGLKFTDSHGAFLPLRDIAEQLRIKLAKLSDSQKQSALTAIFGADAYRAAAIMSELGAAGVDKYTKSTSDLNAAQALAKVGVEGAAGAWEQFTGSVETLAIQLGTRLLPAFTTTVNFVTTDVLPLAGRVVNSWVDFGEKLAPKVEAGFTKAGELIDKAVKAWGPVITTALNKIDLKSVGTSFAKQAAGWGTSIIAGVRTGLDTGDWSGLGDTVGNGIVKAVEAAGKLAGKIGQVIGDLIGKVDWFQLGKSVGLQAPSFIIGFLDSLFDGIIKVAKEHPFAFILTLVSIIFAPAKFLKPIVTVLKKIPIVGTIAAWLLTSLNKLGGPILAGLRFVARGFMQGFRTVFPGIGESFTRWLSLLPTRLGVMALNLQAAALRMMLGLAKAIGKGILWVVVQIGRLIALMLKPFVMAGSWLVRRGIEFVTGLLRGIVSIARGVGRFVLDNFISPLVRPFFLAGRWLVQHGKNFVAGLKNGVVSIARSIGSWAYRTVIVPTVSPFVKAGTWLVQHGKNLIAGLKNGVVSVMKGIGGWIKSTIIDPIVNGVKSFFGIKSPSTVFAGIGSNLIAGLFKGMGSGVGGAIAKKVFGGMPEALNAIVGKGLVSISSLPAKALGALGGIGSKFLASSGSTGGSGVARWRDVAIRALIAAGAPVSWIGSLMRRMNQESGGNPNAINLWDSNAKAGHPSQGLMQTIPGTFNAYAGQFRSRGITDPFANIYAAIRYTIARYGSGPAGWDRPGGYKDGGWLMPGMLGFNETSKPEAVFTQKQLADMAGDRIDYDRLIRGIAAAVKDGRPIEVEQNFPEKADPSAAVDAMAERLAGILGG